MFLLFPVVPLPPVKLILEYPPLIKLFIMLMLYNEKELLDLFMPTCVFDVVVGFDFIIQFLTSI
jgi:hypothetical protein